MIQTIKQNKKAVLAFLLALVMVIGLVPLTATEAHAVEVEATSEGNEAFTGDFTLYLVNKDDPTKTETHTVTYDGTNWSTPKSDILPAYAFAYTGEVNDIAYTDGNWSYTPVLQLDQSDAEKLANADVMIATGEASKEATLDLNFEHVYAKVTFNVELASEFADTDKVTELTVNSDNNVKAFIGETTAEAIIAPSEYAEGESLATVTVDIGRVVSMDLTVKVPEGGLTFEAGTHYTFDLKVGKDKVEIETVTVNGDFPGGWENEVNLDGTSDIIGTPDAGKTEWKKGDFIVIDFTSSKYGNSLRGVGYRNNVWTWTMTPSYLSYLENENPTVNAIYSPYYTIGDLGDVVAGSLGNSDSVTKGECEFIEIGCTLSGKTITADFTSATRNYSRLRIATLPNRILRISVANFIPAGSTTAVANGFYSLTSDANGNAFLYGTFGEGGSISVHDGDNYIEGSGYAELAEYTFESATETGTSYVLDARPKMNITFTEAEVATGYYEIKDLTVAAKCDLHFECKNAEQTPSAATQIPASVNYEIKISAVYTDPNGVTQVLATTDWYDSGTPNYTKTGGDEEETSLSVTQEMLAQAGVQSYSFIVEARAAYFPDTPLNELGQVVHITGSVTN